jgi:hypothetical protein
VAETITHLFLDTNVLDQAWPGLSVKVENTLKAARVLGVIAVLPQPVLVELRKHWRENIDKSLRSAKDTLRKLGILIGNPSLVRVIPEWTVLDSGYDAAVGNLLKNYGLEIAPMPSVGVEELFHQANEQQVAFGEGGSNFKDVVILHSVIEHLQNSGGSGAFVSDDGIFGRRRSECESHANSHKAALRVFKLAEAEEHFQSRLGDEQKQRIERHIKLARGAVEAFLPTAQAVFNTTLDAQRRWRDDPVPEDAVFQKIIDVDLSVGDGEPVEGSEITIYAKVRGTVVARVLESAGNIVSTLPQPIDVNIVLPATFQHGSYSISGATSFGYGWPFHEIGIGPPTGRIKTVTTS